MMMRRRKKKRRRKRRKTTLVAKVKATWKRRATSPSTTKKVTLRRQLRRKQMMKTFHSPAVSVSYDEPLVASPFLNLYVSIGVMFLAKKVDLFSLTMVRIARYVLVR
jgi:hypothetical protein